MANFSPSIKTENCIRMGIETTETKICILWI